MQERIGRTAAADSGLKPRLDAVIERAVAEERIVGAVVLVAADGRRVYARAAGFADRETGRAMTADTIFRLASVTKPIVSVAALALAEAGLMRLDDPVTRFLPDFRPQLPDGRAPTITIRHLMTHTAGLSYGFGEAPDGPYRRAGVSDGLAEPGLSMAENLARIVSAPLLFEPGTAWRYSVATDVLGAAMAAAAGLPLPAVVERLVTAPLGMVDTAFSVRDAERLAVPYADAEPRPARMGEPHVLPFEGGALVYSPARAFDPASFPSGGAGMVGTAGDVMTLLEAVRTGGAPVIGPASVAALTTNAIGDLDLGEPGAGFGLGVSVLKDPPPAGTPQPPGTWQWGGVYGHSWFVDPKRGVTVVILTNTAVAGMAGAFPEAVRDAVYGVG
jgi:CubicO group peptidase (beta-lactamase class C family)